MLMHYPLRGIPQGGLDFFLCLCPSSQKHFPVINILCIIEPPSSQRCELENCSLFKKILFIYSWETEREREREAETQAEGEAGSMQGARCGTRSRVSRIRLWAEGGAKLLSHPAAPNCSLLLASWWNHSCVVLDFPKYSIIVLWFWKLASISSFWYVAVGRKILVTLYDP